MSNLEMIKDYSHQNLQVFPFELLLLSNLNMLYLQNNCLQQLPDDFFLKLPYLTWVDLRNNQLTSIPETVAFHRHLENLLLSNNLIVYLPYELGMVPNLKVLNLGGNPLVYPPREVVAKGTREICIFLRKEYEAHNPMQEIMEEDEEEVDLQSQNQKEDKNIILEIKPAANNARANNSKKLTSCASASLMVRGLSTAAPTKKIVHRLTKSATKLSLKSTYNGDEPKLQRKGTQTADSFILSEVKQNWFDKIKALLADQEKILQQERNLKALSNWRTEKKIEPMRYVSSDEIPEPPFATDPAYNALMTRQDISKGIEQMMINKSAAAQPKQENIVKLINDLAAELKEMEVNYSGSQTPHTQIDVAGKQIQMIMDIHKKLLKLQENNMLQ